MPMFSIKKGIAEPINLKYFSNELELHKLIDKNLDKMFDIRYIRDEYITQKHGRIETLGIDEQNRPVVVEYKLRKERGQLSQANRYMSWILAYRDSFTLLAQKNLGDIKEIDFDNPRILCFAQEFDMDDRCLAVYLGFDVELYKYRYYENNTLVITREKEPEGIIEPKHDKKKTVQKFKGTPRKAKTIEEHLEKSSDKLKELFYQLDGLIMKIGEDVTRYTTNAEITYKTSLNFNYMAIQKKNNCIRLLLRTINDKIKDPKKISEKIPEHFGYGNVTRRLSISPKDIDEGKYSLDDVLSLIQQSYDTTQ